MLTVHREVCLASLTSDAQDACLRWSQMLTVHSQARHARGQGQRACEPVPVPPDSNGTRGRQPTRPGLQAGPPACGASGPSWARGSRGVWARAAPRPRSSPLRAWLSRERLALPFGLSPLARAWSRALRAWLRCVSAGCTVGRRFSVRAGAACLLRARSCPSLRVCPSVPACARVCPSACPPPLPSMIFPL